MIICRSIHVAANGIVSFSFMAEGFPGGSKDKASARNAGDRVQSLGGEDPLEKDMATPLQYSCLENSMDGGASWAIYIYSPGGHRESDMTERLHLK